MSSNQQPRIPGAAIQAAYPTATLAFVDRGGQSDVWRAQIGGRDEALRVIVNPNMARLAHEVDALKQLSSPRLMRFYAVESLRYQGTDYPVVRGEFISGGTIADKLTAGATPTEKEALQCMGGVLDAIAVLHDADLIHRDIKPQNISLRSGRWSRPVVLDLGLIRAVTATSLTNYPNHIGTLPYMSPEQLRGEPAKMRSDTFAAGLVMFDLLTGEHPFLRVGENIRITDLVDRISDPAWPAAAATSRIAADVQPLMLSMIAPAPHERPSAAHALKEVQALLAQRP
jgi:serine/threonine protein kinase